MSVSLHSTQLITQYTGITHLETLLAEIVHDEVTNDILLTVNTDCFKITSL